jgi:hypothetical protein
MSQMVDTNTRSFVAGAAIAQYLRVVLSAGKLAVAGITDRELGQTERRTYADGDNVSVRLRNAGGTCIMVANAAIAVGADVFSAASGKVGASASTARRIGTALTASAADGDWIEVLRHNSDETAVA